eukprot:TRINITY_DN2273_c0_g1_i1.p1 TRINITY_DN2273_c0_g1~~TRINITY_DN2273_c0_g1_i1.p1  ORF type:complete len:156 (+),score=10.34 TRINITY_DN2273_c0_g1_i1:48-470(+)
MWTKKINNVPSWKGFVECFSKVRPSIANLSNTPPKLFGGTLKHACSWSVYGGIPNIIIETIEFLAANALEVEGIFRVSGNSETIEKLKANYEKIRNRILPLSGYPSQNLHNVAGLLKLYFRELYESIIPYANYQQYVPLV